LILNGGFSVGLIKPYYLKLNVTDSLNKYIIEDRKYSSADEDMFLNSKRIYGRSRFGKGLNESKIALGVHFTIATAIDLGSRSVLIKSISFGTQVSVSSTNVPLMIEAKSTPIFINLFAKFIIGKGW
jgi:hypothetical protein